MSSFFIIANLFSCLGVGLFAAILFTGLVYVVCVLMNIRPTLGSILSMVGCFIVSFIMGVRLAGAYYAHSFVDEAVSMCNAILNNAGKSADEILASDLPSIVSQEYPSISVIFDYFSFTKGSTAQSLMNYVLDEVTSNLIWSWAWVILVFIVAAVLACLLGQKNAASTSRRDRSSRSDRGSYHRDNDRVRVRSNRRRH